MAVTVQHPPPLDTPGRVPVPASARRWWALVFLVLAQVWIGVQLLVVNVALPAVQADLGLSDSQRRWVVTIYALCFGSLIILGGKVSDLIGRRRALLIGLVGFAATSTLAAAAVNPTMLLLNRAGQGVFGALVAPSVLATLSELFDSGKERGRAFGILGASMNVGGALGLIIGGALTEVASWRWCLAIGVPAVLAAAVGIAATVHLPPVARRPRLDVRGAILVTAALGSIVLGFDRASDAGWGAGSTVGAIAVGVALLVVFVAAQRRTAEPMLRLGLVWHPVRGSTYLAVLTLGIGVFAAFYFLTFYLQSVRDYSALRTGFAFVPSGIAGVVAAPFLARAITRVPARRLLVGGLAALATSLALLTQLDVSSSYVAVVLPAFMLLGIAGTSVMVTASSTATFEAGADTGVAGAAVGAHQQIGAALGTALLGSIAAAATAGRLETGGGRLLGERAAEVHGYSVASAWGSALVMLGAVVVLVVARRPARSADGARRRRRSGRRGRLAASSAGAS